MRIKIALIIAAWFVAWSVNTHATGSPDIQHQVADTERAFAKTMADRDHQAFNSFLADEAVFFAGTTPLRGKQVISEQWKPYYDGPDAPFSWQPEHVEVLESGTLALSSGPVYDAAGKRIATFTSIWRLEAPGEWRIVFDKGNAACNCPASSID